MRRISLIWAVVLMMPAGLMAAVDPGPAEPRLHKLSGRIYTLVGQMDVPSAANKGYMCNATFVITDSGVVVIDTGGSLQTGRMLLSHIRKVTDKPVTHIINTHAHADHWFGNHAFSLLKPRPVIIGHEKMKSHARSIGPRWLKIMARMTKGASKGTKLVLPDKTIKGSTSLTIGGVVFKLLYQGYAHTHGDLVVWLPQQKVLVTGDILFYKRTPGLRDASPLGNIRALEALLKLPAKYVVPGHGAVSDKRAIRYMLGYLKLLKREVSRYQQQGLQSYEMRSRINVGKYIEMAMFSTQFSNNVFRMYQDVERASFE